MLPSVRKPHTYSIRIVLPQGEVIELNNVHNSLKVNEVKAMIEHDLGIPTELYRLSYLDKADLLDHCTVAQHEIVPRARVNLRPWKMWESVLTHAFAGLMPEMEEYNISEADEQSKFRAFMALFIAAHRGHSRLLERILRLTQVDINAVTRTNWSALHAAARANQWRCLCILIDKGADIMLTDNMGKTALDLSRIHCAKKCEQSLNFCSWNLQKYNQVDRWKKDYSPYKTRDLCYRLAHQAMDSRNSAVLKGKLQTRYIAVYENQIPIQECKKWEKLKTKRNAISHSCDETEQVSSPGEKFDYSWFDPQRAKEFIPGTQVMLTFSDPVAQLKMSKSHSTNIDSLQHIILKKREENKQTSFSKWLEDKMKLEEEMRMQIKQQTYKEEQVKARQKRDREMNSKMSYLRWLHNFNSNKLNSLKFKEELDEVDLWEKELNEKEEIIDFRAESTI